MAIRIFHVDLDAFFVAVECALDPSLVGKPVVVGGEPGGRGVVACASYEARAYGLHAGMSISQAQRLCPHALFLKGQFARYRETSHRFMAILGDYTPFLEPAGIDEAYMDMTGFEALYGPMAQTAKDIKSRVFGELGVTVSIGIAGSRVTAKVASDLRKPDGLTEVSVGEDALFLALLPVEKLPGVGGKTAKALRKWGIRTIGELAQVPAPTLRRLLGVWGDVLLRNARGEGNSLVNPLAPAKSVSRETTFYHDTLNMNFLAGTLRYLSERVGAQLRREEKLARRAVLKLRYSDFRTVSRSLTFPRPTDADGDTFHAGISLLRKALAQRRAPVRLIGIGLAEFITRPPQLPLMAIYDDRKYSLALVVDTIREKYGFTSIQRGLTFSLENHLQSEDGQDLLNTSALS